MEKPQLLKKRKVLRTQVTTLVHDIEQRIATTDCYLTDLKERLERLNNVNALLKDVDSQIESLLTEEEFEEERMSHCYSRQTLQRLYKNAEHYDSTDRTSETSREDVQPSQANNARRTEYGAVRLPKLELMEFDGRRHRWQQFWRQFQSTIHENRSLSNADKMNYLMAALQGEAANAVQGLQLTSGTYDTAISILRERFGNDHLMIQEHLQKLADIEPVRSSRQVYLLRKLHDTIQAHIRGLQGLGTTMESYCSMVYPVLLRALPNDMALQFHRRIDDNVTRTQSIAGESSTSTAASYHKEVRQLLITYLGNEVRYREELNPRTSDHAAIAMQKQSKENNYNRTSRQTEAPVTTLHSVTKHGKRQSCVFCNDTEHNTTKCTSCKSLDEKKRTLAMRHLCFRCTKPNHFAKQCRSNPRCATCSGRHASSMCDPESCEKSHTLHHKPRHRLPLKVLSLRQLIVPYYCKLRQLWLEERSVRLIFDGCSQRTFINRSLYEQKLIKKIQTERVSIGSFGSQASRSQLLSLEEYICGYICGHATESHCISSRTDLRPESRSTNNSTPRRDAGAWSCNGRFVDSHQGEQVAILIGADYYWAFATERTHKLQNGVQAVETTLGWTLQGPYAHTSALHSTTCNNITVLRLDTLSKVEITRMMDQIWILEGVGIQKHEIEKMHPVMENFERTIEYKGGRCVAALPWKEEVSMEDNKGIALRRLSQVTRRLMKPSQSMTDYDTAIREYIESGVAERVIESTGTANKTGHTYYMPHHAVVKEDCITTKIMIVFDAPAHEAFTKSLNENLHAGPNLNPDIMTVILNFRLYPMALISDVQKAFLQMVRNDTQARGTNA
ncbi:uncharacterized protein LOC135391985 [Ornithodoros turicata]|uniref:uncharacterized protein LOC135391985 n=1 Tax=Ornithodoros turicata TaxID=34597 RepID=UPI003139D5B1